MLRRAETADLAAIQALIRAFPLQLLDRGEGFLADLAADPDSRLLVWDRGGFAGFAMVEGMYPGVVNLSNLAVTARGKGEGRALIAAVQEVVFAEMAMHRIFLDVAADNAAGLRAFEAAGFVREGTMRECWLRPDGIWTDCHAWSMLRREWQARP
ncbi:GNAT family N-acetyltransferase [Rhodobacter sp. SGA-6-6]|uniref:GNAT family N-acetyltransferase n=1 Tax=Rhodobacter sp. SGA-6-6 TaxID=2710882 RepID=UPI0013EC1F8E|nr:GNAT family protein [Rhodobacter sp. SGA-6-6]NGM47244.1 GNAT family N-acetyltransferase [Rhodobacter sp. SGA-6-6]